MADGATVDSEKSDEQKNVDQMALAISTAESYVQETLRKTLKVMDAFYAFRKNALGGDGIHVMEGALLAKSVGEAAMHLGLAAEALGIGHGDLERIRDHFKMPLPTRTRGISTLGNGGGKNGKPQNPPVPLA